MRPKHNWLALASASFLQSAVHAAEEVINNYNHDFHLSASNYVAAFLNDAALFNNLMDHGCWCAYIDPNNSAELLMGPTPIDALDEICRNWYLTRHCNDELIGGSCTNADKALSSF